MEIEHMWGVSRSTLFWYFFHLFFHENETKARLKNSSKIDENRHRETPYYYTVMVLQGLRQPTVKTLE